MYQDEDGNMVWSVELDIYGKVNEFTVEKDFIQFRYQGQMKILRQDFTTIDSDTIHQMKVFILRLTLLGLLVEILRSMDMSVTLIFILIFLV